MSGGILVLPGDGVGPEVAAEAEKVLAALIERGLLPPIEISRAPFGGAAVDECGEPLPPETEEAARGARAVLLGAVGGPRYDSLQPAQRPESGLLALRKALGVFANLRPASCHDELADSSSLRPELVRGLDILIVRELVGGIYFGEPRGIEQDASGERVGFNTMRYGEGEIRRVARAAFAAAERRGGRLCSVDKANVLEVSRLWREVVSAIGSSEFPGVDLSHMYVDNAAMQLLRAPKQFDVILTGNLFGDVLSDAAAMLTGSIGMLPSAALDESGRGVYEPVHGSAPDIAGQDKANPLAAILSAEMMLRHSLDALQAADAVRDAVKATLRGGSRTADIARPGEAVVGCAEMGSIVVNNIVAGGDSAGTT